MFAEAEDTHMKKLLRADRWMIPVLAVAVILAAVFAFSTVTSAGHTQAAQRSTVMTYESVRISGGDTLWSIAQEYHGITDMSDFVDEIKALNGLSSDSIHSGAYLIIPVEVVL